MIGTLYRYPHPNDLTRFIYVGQGPKRDTEHRLGKGSFGRRFKQLFPDVELPQPIREQVEVRDHLELNELETIWIFRYHTWYTYDGGMNLTLPGSVDYKEAGKIGGNSNAKNKTGFCGRTPERMSEIGRKYGGMGGRVNVESGHLARISSKGGKAQGRICAETKTGVCGQSLEKMQENGRKGDRLAKSKATRKRNELYGNPATSESCSKGGCTSTHLRWHVKINRPNPRCVLCSEQSLIITFA